jgi:hypothetical protein
VVKGPDQPTQRERVTLAIWDYARSTVEGSSAYPTMREISEATGIPSSTVYKVIDLMERRREIKRVKDEKNQFHIIPLGSPLAGNQSEQLIYDHLYSQDPQVAALALRDLDELSREDRIHSDNLLKYITDKRHIKSGLNFRILTRQVNLAKRDNDMGTLHRLKLRVDKAEEITRDMREDEYFRDEAFIYLKNINLDRAVRVALTITGLNELDEAMDSDESTQLWLDISTTLAAASTQPSIRRTLLSRITKANREKNPHASARARKILNAP